VQNPTPTIVLF